MKRITILFTALFLTIGATNSQEQTRETLLDSIATTLLKNERFEIYTFVDTMKNELRSEINSNNELQTEIAWYRVQKDLMTELFQETYKELSNEELKTILTHINSKAYRVINSYEVNLETALSLIPPLFIEVISKEVNKEVNKMRISMDMELNNTFTDVHLKSTLSGLTAHSRVSGININEYKISNKEFSQIYDSFFNKGIKKHTKELYELYRKSEKRKIKDEYYDEFFQAMEKYLPHVHKAVLFEYINTQQLKEYTDFYNSETGNKLKDINISQILFSVEELIKNKNIAEELKKHINKITTDDYAQYIKIRKNMYTDVIAPRRENVSSIAFDKGTYSGETFEGIPHGYGTYTDKKGDKYTGNFKHGKKHGKITIETIDGTNKVVIYANDKKMKKQSTGLNKQEKVPEAPTYTDKNDIEYMMGYGYKTVGNETRIGMFVDNNLEGEGQFITHNKQETGTFKNGQFIEGTITTNNNRGVSIFEGKKTRHTFNDYYNGIYKYEDDLKSWKMLYQGTSINYRYDGDGLYNEIHSRNSTILKRKGYFAHNTLYGQGIEYYYSKNEHTAIYTGFFVNSKKHGEGKLIINSLKSKELSQDIIRYENMIFKSNNDSTSIILNGTFDNNILTKGRIEMSNGDYLEGVYKDGVLAEGKCKITNNSTRVISVNFYFSQYEGEIKDGLFNGKGKLIHNSGYIEEGTFKDNKLIKGTKKNNKGRIIKRL